MSFLRIVSVVPGSPAFASGIAPGEELLGINGMDIKDTLDYMQLTYDKKLTLTILDNTGVKREILLRHDEGGDIGLVFDSFLLDEEKTCRNNCIFCFIDQMPPNCRESLYVKDDDARLSFFMGNYISLTNLSESDIERICSMRISPLCVSVHTTNPELRVKMLRNKNAGKCLDILKRFTEAGICINAQIVLCPGYNDGSALEETLRDLEALGDSVGSVSVVPVGLTDYRDGLSPLLPVTPEIAFETICICGKYKGVYCADELYIGAGLDLPPYEHYNDFPQLQNGVGMMRLFLDEFASAYDGRPFLELTVATGEAAAPFLALLLKGTRVRLVVVKNRFFGGKITVSGLLTGRDYYETLKGLDLGEAVLIPKNSLKRDEDIFLDNMTVDTLSSLLKVRVIPVQEDGAAFYRALCGELICL